MRNKLAWLLAVLVMVGMTGTASAHVLVTDDSNQTGAILHITPDDDPVAGQPSEIFFDVQGASGGLRETSLTITGPDGSTAEIPVTVKGSTLNADFVFRSQGVYRLIMTTNVADAQRTFEYSQRVSRGVVNGPESTDAQAWGEPVLIASIIGICALAIIAFNRLRYTKKNITRNHS